MKTFCCLTLALLTVPLASAQVTEKYETAAKKKWETTIQKFEALDKKTDYAPDSILFVGSSSIRLWETLEKDMAPHPVIQRGYGGAKFQDLAVFAKRIIHPHDFKAVVIFVANDIAGNDGDLEPKEVAELFGEVVKTARAKKADVPVFLIAITPTESRWKVWPEQKQANAAMQELCKADKNLHFIATEKRFLNADGKPKAELFRDDKLHLNADGYALWTKIVRGRLEKKLQLKSEAEPE